ncbi:MAG TPA: hypothetical protein VNB94_06430 [Mycobacteriales bacterium]|nr:hypothetical protein [Mycobacteriales bacterium]
MSDSPDADAAERTYAGWKAGLLIIGALLVVGLLVNYAGERAAPRPTDRPPPVVVTITPSG